MGQHHPAGSSDRRGYEEDAVTTKHPLHNGASATSRGRSKGAKLATVCAALIAVVLVAGALALAGPHALWAQEETVCATLDLGTLSNTPESGIEAAGRWTTEDCDSAFRSGSDAHVYRFEVVEGGRIRVDLTSSEADSYLYLLDEEGTRLTDNDDGGAGLNARVERDLTPGIYLIEATTVGGRGRGAADFSLSVSHVAGCEPVDLGALGPEEALTASGSWTLDTCGSGFVVEHPAHRYLFTMPEDGRVVIDLMSTDGDPVLSLVSLSAGLIGANDDGGDRRNSRIERYLSAGIYLIEATTYLERDYQPLRSDFDLVVRFVDEKERQQSFQIKVEQSYTPDQVVAGEPFPVHYRVGNLGGGDLATAGGSVRMYVVGPRVFDITPYITASSDRWQAGVSYHTGQPVANTSSTEVNQIAPFEAVINSPGPTWLFVGAVTYNTSREEVGFHGLWRNLMVVSGRTYDPVTVTVDDLDYRVMAEADEDGIVTPTVSSVSDPDADVDPVVRAKAIYAAGVRTQVLEGLFERPGIAGLTAPEETAAVSVDSPSSTTLLTRFAERYAAAVSASGLADVLARGEVINPAAVEDIVLGVSQTSSAQYGYMAASWTALQEQIDGGAALSFAEAFTLQSELAYAERVLAPTIRAGEVLEASREAEDGWEGRDIQAMMAELARQVSCNDPAQVLQDALEATEAADLDDLLALDAELGAAAPVFRMATDGALCAASAVDTANSRFLRSLSIAGSADLRELVAPDRTPAPYTLRIIARVHDDGRIEHGVELANGQQVLPSVRYLATNAAVDQWRTGSIIEVGGTEIGKTRARHLADGRVELGFQTADGKVIEPEVRYLPADLPNDVWLRSGEIEVLLE